MKVSFAVQKKQYLRLFVNLLPSEQHLLQAHHQFPRLCTIFFTVFLYLLHILHHCCFSEFQVALHSQRTFSSCLQVHVGTFSLATHNTQGAKYIKIAQIYLHRQRESSQLSAGSPQSCHTLFT